MREILFRGKSKHGEWYFGFYTEGYYLDGTPVSWIEVVDRKKKETDSPTVIPETVGQFTGLTDKNGKKVFEGDIIEWFSPEVSEYPSIAYIEYDEESFTWRVCWQEYDPDWLEGLNKEYISVIGNIHDNPELLGGDRE